MPRYYPALILLTHPLGAEISLRAQMFIQQRLGLAKTPAIFQFFEATTDVTEEEIRVYYHAALSKRAAAEAQADLHDRVESSRIETFVVASIEPQSVALAKKCAKAIDNCARDTVAGGRNAIFLASRNLLSLNEVSRQHAAQELNLAMQEPAFPFNRCFFIDDINEMGQTVTIKSDLIDLVANFITLSIASDLCEVLQNNPPPYDGARGLHHKAYASFSCNTIGFKPNALIDGLAYRLARDIVGQLVCEKRTRNNYSALVAQSVSWFNENGRALEQELTGHGSGNKPGNPETSQSVFVAANRAAELRLDQFINVASEALKYDLGAFRDFVEQALDHWLVGLERLADQVKLKKKRIAELSIKSILGIPGTMVYQAEITEKPRWWQVFRRPRTRVVNRTRNLEPEIALREARREHAILNQVLDIQIGLFNRLDMTCLNLDRLKQSLKQPGPTDFQSIFNVDLVDNDLADKFYLSSEYQYKNSHIDQFVRSPEFVRFRSELTSYPDGVPEIHLFDYCKRCFQFVETYNVEKICSLKRLFKDREFLYLSPPFWKPVSLATGERLVIVLCDKQLTFNLRSVVDSRTNPTNEIYVHSNDPSSITIIQMTYGLRLEDVFFPLAAERETAEPLSAVAGAKRSG